MPIAFSIGNSVGSRVSGAREAEARMLRIKKYDKYCWLSPSIHFPFFHGNGAPDFWLCYASDYVD